MKAAAVPGTGHEVGEFVGAWLEEQGLEGVELEIEFVHPDGWEGEAAGNGFEGEPEGGVFGFHSVCKSGWNAA
jgi:hypothetical protein